MRKYFSLICLLFLIFGEINAQISFVKGRVTDINDIPIIGASVLVKGSTVGTITDMDGNYSLSVPNNNCDLIFSFVGMLSQTIKVNNQKIINVRLSEDNEVLDEVVVVGYGTMKKSDLTGSVSSVSEKNFVKGALTSPEQLIMGKIAGIQITPQDGTPGAGSKIHIRGTNSIKSGNSPLYIVDGIPMGTGGESSSGFESTNQVYTNPMNSINPNDIESISVLKDASAASIYGARAANGVVLITTKKGKEGKFTAFYEGKAILSTPAKYYDVLSADEFRKAIKDINLSINDGNTSTDWQKEIMRTSLSQSHYLNMSGGLGKGTFMGSVGYNKTLGIIKNSDMESITARMRVTQKALNDKLDIDFNISTSNIEYGNIINGYWGVMYNALIYNPTQPVYNEDGTYNEIDMELGEKRNPVALLNIDDNLRQKNIQTSLSGTLKITNDLSFKVNTGYNTGSSTRQFYYPYSSPLGYSQHGLAAKRSTNNESLLVETILSFNKTIQKHNIQAMAGYSWQNWKNDGYQVMVQNFLFDEISFDNLAAGGSLYEKPSSYRNQNKLISHFGRVNYNYNNKYLMTLTLRHDGSTRFGDNNKWGLFPSVAAAWRLSEESFFKTFKNLSDLKLRVGYGEIGNQEIPSGLTLSVLNAKSQMYPMDGNGTLNSGVAPSITPNKDLKWETTGTFNVGLDFGFFNNRYSGSVEFYNKDTKDLLLQFTAPQPYISNTLWTNIGKVNNKGVEFQFNGNIIESKNLTWNVAFNVAYNKNEVKNLSTDQIKVEEIKHFYPMGLGYTGNTIGLIKGMRSKRGVLLT